MDVLTFIAQALAATAWPICVLVIVVMLRRPVIDLIPSLRKLKWKGLEAEFEKGLVQARQLIDAEATQLSASKQSFPEKDRKLLDNLAGAAPRYVVLESWREVEEALLRTARTIGAPEKLQRARASTVAADSLLKGGEIGNAEFQVITILRNLRNRAVHEREFELSSDDAVEYADAARWLVEVLGQASKAQGPQK